MNQAIIRRLLFAYLLLLAPIGWLASRFDKYQIDGDAVAYMDIADLLRVHNWAAAVNGYWHPLYPACLALAQLVLHPTRMNELGAYYTMNYGIFLAQVVATLLFVTALDRLRARMMGTSEVPLLSLDVLRLLGVGLVVIASQRELSMGKVRPDALLQALMLAAVAMLLESLASESLVFAPLMGLFFGLAYLTKSFALVMTLLAIMLMMLFQTLIQRRSLGRVVIGGTFALVVFATFAGPFVIALSIQKHRFDIGDSGALNYAWYSGGTEKMHLEPWQTNRFGSATVNLIHPETQLLAMPGIYSYRALPYGTYPDWFDTTYFNERIIPHFNLRLLIQRDARNLVLVIRYLVSHLEAWILLALLLVFGARFGFTKWRTETFWAPPVFLGLSIWLIYGIVNIEERYVTLGYLLLILPTFAALRPPAAESPEQMNTAPSMQWVATALVAALAFLALGESLRIAADERRDAKNEQLPHTWYSKQIYGAALGLKSIGLKPGDEIACMGNLTCLNSHYFARLAEVRILTEVYNTSREQQLAELEALPNRQQVYDIVKGQGAKVMVAHFDPGAMTGKTPASSAWVRLGETEFYALPLNLTPAPAEKPQTHPWSATSGPLP